MAGLAQSSTDAMRLFHSYRPLPGVPDELVCEGGAMRPGWAGLIAHLSGLGPDEIAHDFARGDQYLTDAGVFFRSYGDTSLSGRDWPFSPIPIILPQAEWSGITAGLMQRADLLEQVVADLYGPNRLVADGHLPASLIAENPEWLRPMVGITPASGHFLHFLAFEIGRGPDGRWWVLSDRTDAPSGAGFALENRVATSRVYPDLFRQTNVHRLAGFFRAFRQGLDHLCQTPAARIGILTPGPLTDTYYEQAYIARYLGLNLLAGEDLTVQDGRLQVRTVQGLVPVEVLWRRMDSAWADPLELAEQSQIGTAGLVSAIRQGQVTMVNALGAGVLETQALMAFLPKISKLLTGQPLALPNVATWWCGQPAELAHVRANAGRMMIGPALSTRMPFESDAPHAIAGQITGADETDLDRWLATTASHLVGQELVTLSTTPVFENGALAPRPMTIRVFLARTPDGWQVMPGGFGRIGAGQDATAIAMRSGGAVADVWVVSDTPVEAVSMLARTDAPFQRAQLGPLPSRAADNLFWLGRYVERTEGILRLARAYHSRLDEAATEPLLALIRERLAVMNVDADQAMPDGLGNTLASAVNSASQVRDRFSVDAWSALKDLEKTMGRMGTTARPGNDASLAMSVLLRKIAGFAGLVHENMYRATAWQFLTIGRSLERAAMMADLLAVVIADDAPDGATDLAIEIGDSTMIHRQRYAVTTTRNTAIDMLALDPQNPRSIRFHLRSIRRRVEDLTAARPGEQMTDFERAVLDVETRVALHAVETLDSAALQKLHGDILGLSTALQHAHLQ
ncbi:MAG: circularly permuted type 2 ATP-grasp protein [Rhodobacterales bacterium]